MTAKESCQDISISSVATIWILSRELEYATHFCTLSDSDIATGKFLDFVNRLVTSMLTRKDWISIITNIFPASTFSTLMLCSP